MGSLPVVYVRAEWRNTTPIDAKTGRVGVGFDVVDGQPLRLSLSPESIRDLVETLQPYLVRTQSDTSSGMPSLDVSSPLEGENV